MLRPRPKTPRSRPGFHADWRREHLFGAHRVPRGAALRRGDSTAPRECLCRGTSRSWGAALPAWRCIRTAPRHSDLVRELVLLAARLRVAVLELAVALDRDLVLGGRVLVRAVRVLELGRQLALAVHLRVELRLMLAHLG